jgi:hypothetical protein
MFWSKKKKVEYKEGDIIFHPNKNIESPLLYCFECDGKHYFRFSNDYEIPKGRFQFVQKFYHETTLKISSDDLKKFCIAIKDSCNKGNLGDAYKLADELEYRDTWLFEPETLLRFASAIYFTLDEDVTNYDFDFNDKKIELFKKKNMLRHFLMTLMNAPQTLSDLSEEDLRTYLRQLIERTKKQLELIASTTDSKSK